MPVLTARPAQAAPVTVRGLLAEMVDRDALARWPEPAYTTAEATSYDRGTVGPDQPGWFANNDGTGFIRTEVSHGREERVMMEADGPGAIVRFWLTSGGERATRIRVYLDGADEPAIEWPSFDLLNGGPDVAAPLRLRHPAPEGHGGSTLYLPIPYARHCKVTMQETDPAHTGPRYFQVEYRTYAPGTDVQTYSPAALAAARPEVDRVNRLLARPAAPANTRASSLERTLAPGSTAELALPAGPGAVRQLEITVGADLPPAVREQALRSVVLRGAFDSEPEAIWCPVGDFAGSGAGGRPVASWYRDADGQGKAVCRWTMPYRASGRLMLENLGGFSVRVRLVARTGAWRWDERSLYFHAAWRQQTHIPARPYSDWNMVTVAGRGVLVGDVMSVFNPLPAWYGEGDEKIWVDGERFPAHLGTGTEDYYNASWAPNGLYQSPFANHPRMDEPHGQGQNVYTRTRSLDAVPFERALKFDFEIITWQDSQVDYATTAYWYGAPGARGGVGPQPDEARRPVPALAPPLSIPGALECENLAVVARTEGIDVHAQEMGWSTANLSARAHLLLSGRKVGDFVELAIPATDAAPRRLTLFATQAFDYGIVRFSVNGQPVADTFDGYAPNPAASGPIPLGVFTPQNGRFLLRAELVGTNPKSGGQHYLAGLDAVLVER